MDDTRFITDNFLNEYHTQQCFDVNDFIGLVLYFFHTFYLPRFQNNGFPTISRYHQKFLLERLNLFITKPSNNYKYFQRSGQQINHPHPFQTMFTFFWFAITKQLFSFSYAPLQHFCH